MSSISDIIQKAKRTRIERAHKNNAAQLGAHSNGASSASASQMPHDEKDSGPALVTTSKKPCFATLNAKEPSSKFDDAKRRLFGGSKVCIPFDLEAFLRQPIHTILSLPPFASVTRIESGFGKFALQHHPDKLVGLPPNEVKHKTALFQFVGQAKEFWIRNHCVYKIFYEEITFYDLLYDGYSTRDYYESNKSDTASSKQTSKSSTVKTSSRKRKAQNSVKTQKKKATSKKATSKKTLPKSIDQLPPPQDYHSGTKPYARQEFQPDSTQVTFIKEFFQSEVAYSDKTIAILSAIMMGQFDREHQIFCIVQAVMLILFERWEKNAIFEGEEGQEFLDKIVTVKEIFAYAMSLNGKYHFNTGDDVRHGVHIQSYKHWAPPRELMLKFKSNSTYRDPFNSRSGIMNRNNPCLRALDIIARCMFERDMHMNWTDEVKSKVDLLINFSDSNGYIPTAKSKIDLESRSFAEEANLGALRNSNGGCFDAFDVLMRILVPFVGAQAMYNKFTSGLPPLNVLVMSSATRELFDTQIFLRQLEAKGHFESESAKVLFLSHGQTWVMRICLTNSIVHSDAHLKMYEHSLAVGFTSLFAEVTQKKEEEVLALLEKTTIARGFAMRNGANLDDETSKQVLQAILDCCRRGGRSSGKIIKDRFECFLDAFKLYDSFMMKEYAIQPSLEDFIEHIPESFEGDEYIRVRDALKGIENSLCFRLMVAKNAKQMGHATVDQLALLDSQVEMVSALRNKEAQAERALIGGDTKMREHRCRDCGNIQSFMIDRSSRWDCLDKENVKKFSLDREAVAGIILPNDKMPQPNEEGKYPGKFSLLIHSIWTMIY